MKKKIQIAFLVAVVILGFSIIVMDYLKEPKNTSTNTHQTSKDATVSYMVIDLSGGTKAGSFPVRFSTTPPDLNDDTCRTTEMWLRRIPAGSFMMGSNLRERCGKYGVLEWWNWGWVLGDEDRHKVTLTIPFYMGVFEVTQKQWDLVMGKWNGSVVGWLLKDTDGMRPVVGVSYDDIRGKTFGRQWPMHNQVDATSFMGVLRTKTRLMADLPTEAQWEYACRAGTTTALNSGKKLTDEKYCTNLAELGRNSGNKVDGKGGYFDSYTQVGMYKPNTWGLYDMHGNVWELCLDWYTQSLGTDTVTDPKGAALGETRVKRGGSYDNYASKCRSAYRSQIALGPEGFRVCIMSE